MNLMNELVTAYLENNFEHPYYLDLHEGQVLLDIDESISGEEGIDWDDEESHERYLDIPKIDSSDAFSLRNRFAQCTKADPEELLIDALNEHRPFRRFKDALSELDLWDEWNKFEYADAEESIRTWLEEFELSYDELNVKFKEFYPFSE